MDDFIVLVKETRRVFGVSIEEAHNLIFADETMKRLIVKRINNEPACRKQAVWNMRHHGERSRFVMEGDRIRFRD